MTTPFVCFSCRKQFERNWDGKEDYKDFNFVEIEQLDMIINSEYLKNQMIPNEKKQNFLETMDFIQRVYDNIE